VAQTDHKWQNVQASEAAGRDSHSRMCSNSSTTAPHACNSHTTASALPPRPPASARWRSAVAVRRSRVCALAPKSFAFRKSLARSCDVSRLFDGHSAASDARSPATGRQSGLAGHFGPL